MHALLILFLILSQKGDWAAEKVITIPPKKVEGWALPHMPGIYIECLFGFDFLFFLNEGVVITLPFIAEGQTGYTIGQIVC